MATFLHQGEENPPLSSLSTGHLRQSAPPRASPSRGGDAFGEPRIRTRSSDLPARKGGRPGPMAGCGSVSCDGSLNQDMHTQACRPKRRASRRSEHGQGGDAGFEGRSTLTARASHTIEARGTLRFCQCACLSFPNPTYHRPPDFTCRGCDCCDAIGPILWSGYVDSILRPNPPICWRRFGWELATGVEAIPKEGDRGRRK